MTWEHAGSSTCFEFSVSKRVNASVYQTKSHEMVMHLSTRLRARRCRSLKSMREEMTHANAVTPLFATRWKLSPLPVKMISGKMIEKLASCNFHFLFPREQQERQLTFELCL